MKMSTVKLLVPIVAITVQSNSASTIIPPFLHDLSIPMAHRSLISLGPVLISIAAKTTTMLVV